MKQTTPVHLLRSFEAAARHSSFTMAAGELNVTQAAISKQVKALEKELNCLLFNRSAHGVTLTHIGERYWQEIKALLNKIDKITTQLFAERDNSTITIRANISYSLDVLSHKLDWFANHYPQLSIELIHNVWSKHGQQMGADIEIDYRSIEPQNKSFRLLHHDLMFPVIATTLATEKINKLPLIKILGYYSEWDWWLENAIRLPDQTLTAKFKEWINNRQKDIRHNQNILRVDNSLSAYKLAMQGNGIALARSSLVQNYLVNKQLKRMAKKIEFQAIEGFHVRLSESGRANKACVEFVEDLLKTESVDYELSSSY